MIIGELGYILIPVGIWLVFFDAIKGERAKRKQKKKIELYVAESEQSSINLALKTTLGIRGKNAGLTFVFISGALGLGSMILLRKSAAPLLVLIFGIIAAVIPYIMLRIRVEKKRIKASNEGEILITTILNNYKIAGFNVLKAIELSALELDEAPNSKRLILRLFRDLTTAETTQEIEEAIVSFRFSLGTFWGNILCNNIKMALIDGVEITEALKDLSKIVVDLRNMKEGMQRERNETKAMLRIMFPAMYLVTVYSALGFFKMGLTKYLSYQFGTPQGRFWIGISLFSYIAAIAVNAVLSKEKLDLR